jgi:hypothetical protein
MVDAAQLCAHCGERPRRSAANRCLYCAVCRPLMKSVWDKGYRAKHAEPLKARKKAYYEANREHDNAKARQWRQANIDRAKARARSYREEHAAEAAARVLRWQRANPDKVQAIIARRRARKLAALPLDQTAEERDAIAALWAARPDGMQVDHIVPLAPCRACGSTGLHALDNMQYLPVLENRAKGNRCQPCYEADRW